MPQVTCPHCGESQENPQTSGPAGRRACARCGASLAFQEAVRAGGRTQPLGDQMGASPPPTPQGYPEARPVRMGPYEVRETLGAGGMGIVYRGWDASLNRTVALKTLRADLARDAGYRERFLREARAAASLSHPNVTQIYTIGEAAGQPFFAMEFLEGKSLETLVRERGKLPPSEAADLVRQAALGLKAAAARGIVHRDIKPSNLMLTGEGILKVTDFGLAKIVVADSGLTLAGEVLGSPNYMAPEQACGQPSDLRSDIYSLGATLYELVTGRPPFDGPTAVSIILKHAREPVRNPRQLTPGLPYPLVSLIQKMLAKRIEDRPQNYDLLLREIDRVRSGAETTRLPASAATPQRPAPPDSGRPTSRSSGAWILLSLLLLIVLGAWGLARQRQPRDVMAPGRPPGAPGSASSSPGTDIVSSTSEVSPPGLGSRLVRGAISLPPRLERMQEAARANLQFLSNTHEITSDGRLRVMGSVLNTGLGRATDVEIRILLTDPAGKLLGSTTVPLSPALLGPRQSGTFEAFFPDPHEPISIRTELNWNS
jgi:serine/threonine protein kinase